MHVGAVRCPLCGAANESVGTCRICGHLFAHPFDPAAGAPAASIPLAEPAEIPPPDDEPAPRRAHRRRRRLRRWVVRGAVVASAAAVVAGAVIAAPRLIDRVDSDDTQSDAVILGEQVDADAWVEFKDPDGAFSVQLPRTPDRAEATSPVAAARTTTVSYVARNGVAAVGVTKIVSADNAPFDPSAAAASKAESIGATLTITATGTDPAGRSYVEGRMENDTIQVLARWIANGATGYLLQVVASFEAPSLATFTRLVASFQIIA